MRLLVSVRDAIEAKAALAGGADIIDAKEPFNGALGPVTPRTLLSITGAIAGAAAVSMALGDVGRDDIFRGARAATSAGVAFVKIGFAGGQAGAVMPDVASVGSVLHATSLVAVAYADYEAADAPSPDELLAIAGQIGARGILLDTYDKTGPGLTTLMTDGALRGFVARAQSLGQFVALAGKLTAEDIDFAHDVGADIVGFRGAACDGGRSGVVNTARVRALRRQVDRAMTLAC